MAKPKRAWVDDPQTTRRMHWAITESQRRVESEPWAAVVLAHVAVEVAVALIVHRLTEHQEPALRRWIEDLRADPLSRDEDLGLVNALLSLSGERIEDDAELWTAMKRHVRLRNEFLPRGEVPTVDDARDSVTTCIRFHDWLLTLGGKANRKMSTLAAARRRALARQLALEAPASNQSGDASPESA